MDFSIFLYVNVIEQTTMGNLFSQNNCNSERDPSIPQPNLYDDLMIEYKQQIAELQKQNKALAQQTKEMRKQYNELYKAVHDQQHTPEHAPQMPINTPISTDLIHQYVQNMLDQEEYNIGYIPDFVERQIYEKFFRLLLALLERTIETSSIKIMGHEIRFYLTAPLPEQYTPQQPPQPTQAPQPAQSLASASVASVTTSVASVVTKKYV